MDSSICCLNKADLNINVKACSSFVSSGDVSFYSDVDKNMDIKSDDLACDKEESFIDPPTEWNDIDNEEGWGAVSEDQMTGDELAEPPRTSTPIPYLMQKVVDEDIIHSKDQYNSWIYHLEYDEGKKYKVRGAWLPWESIISAQFDMKTFEPFEEDKRVHRLTDCFLKLAMNAPFPKILLPSEKPDTQLSSLPCYCCCRNDGKPVQGDLEVKTKVQDEKYCNANIHSANYFNSASNVRNGGYFDYGYFSNANIQPTNLIYAKNGVLPIGYKYSDNGHAVPSMSQVRSLWNAPVNWHVGYY